MSIFCRLGLHSWHVLEKKTLSSLHREVFGTGGALINVECNCYKRVCLKCKKCENSIDPTLRSLQRRKADQEHTHDYAKQLYEEECG